MTYLNWKDEFGGRSLSNPVTFRSCLLSTLTVLLMGFSFPNKAFAVLSVSTMEYGSRSALFALPSKSYLLAGCRPCKTFCCRPLARATHSSRFRPHILSRGYCCVGHQLV